MDAQAPGWYEREHLGGALPSDARDLAGLVDTLRTARPVDIVVYCWSETCDASARVSAELARRGFSNVRRYVEGKKDCLEAGLPLEGSERTDSNHQVRA